MQDFKNLSLLSKTVLCFLLIIFNRNNNKKTEIKSNLKQKDKER